MTRKITIDIDTARYFLAVEKALAKYYPVYVRQAITGYPPDESEMYHTLLHNEFDKALTKPEYKPRQKFNMHQRGLR